MFIKSSSLPYHKRTHGEYRDLRQWEVKLPKRKWARLTLNGQYRNGKSRTYKLDNPGWVFGSEWCFVEWTHFRRHCVHLSFEVGKRGITFSYGRWI